MIYVFLVFQDVLVFLPRRVDAEMRRETAQLFVYSTQVRDLTFIDSNRAFFLFTFFVTVGGTHFFSYINRSL